MKRVLVTAFITLVLMTGCSGSSTEVSMTDDHAFDPGTITIAAGETVTFVNDSRESHSVTAYEDEVPEGAEYLSSGGFSSEQEARDSVSEALLDSEATFEVTLDEPGTYRYFCIPHESQGMTGPIEVEE